MKDTRDALDFSKEPVGTLFRKMFIPTLIGMISMVILSITDGAFVGHGVGSDALAAVNIVAPIFMIVSGIGLMLGIGSSVVASIHLSKGNTHAANLNLTQGMLVGIIVGVILSILFLCYQEQVCKLFGCSEQLLPQACSYLQWIALLTPFSIFEMTSMFMIRLDGAPKFAGTMNSIAAVLNIALDYIFIYPFQMGIEGAAIASFISFSICCIPLIVYLVAKTKTVHLHRIKFSRTSLYLTLRNVGYQIQIGFSALLGELAIASIMIVGNYMFMHYLGEDGVAAYSVGCYCLPIVFMMGNAIVQSVQPIISFAYGANQPDRLREARKIATIMAIATGLAGTLLLLIGARVISSAFLDQSCSAYTLCKNGLPYFSPAFVFIAMNIVFIGYLQSIEKARAATFLTLLRGFIFSIPCFIIIPLFFGNIGLWLALPLAEFLTNLIIFTFMIKK